jgi:hypothetical protein
MSSGYEEINKVMIKNKLHYALPSNNNLVERRQNKVFFADQNSYLSSAGNEMVIRLGASGDFIYGKNSYLTFNVSGVRVGGGSDAFSFGNNTACSLFSRMLYEDRSGVELERNDKLNSYVAQTAPWHWSPDYIPVGPAMAGQQLATGTSDTNLDCATALTVCIPLRYILGVFDTETLIPNTLISGSLIRLQLAAVNDAFMSLAGTTTLTLASYTLSNPRVIVDSMSLAPTIQKNLMEQSQAGGGLDFTYETAYYQSANPGTSTSFNLQINKAVSRCQKMYWSAHAQTTPSVIMSGTTPNDNLGTGAANVSQLDYRVGDLYFPQRVISVNATSVALVQKNGAELYQNSLQSVGRMKTNYDPPSISKQAFLASGTVISGTAASNNNNGQFVHCQSFEQSSALEYSGLAINNSRTLEARIVFVAVPAANQVIDAWIKYVKLCKSNSVRAIVKE